MTDKAPAAEVDVVLVGAGIMSTTLAVFLKELQPHLRLEIIERMPGEAQESSNAWNNAGTGHAANCELNYTPMRPDGSEVDHCYVSRQPQSEPELDRMIEAAWGAEVECIRYRGLDAQVRARIRERQAENAIDVPDWMLNR